MVAYPAYGVKWDNEGSPKEYKRKFKSLEAATRFFNEKRKAQTVWSVELYSGAGMGAKTIKKWNKTGKKFVVKAPWKVQYQTFATEHQFGKGYWQEHGVQFYTKAEAEQSARRLRAKGLKSKVVRAR